MKLMFASDIHGSLPATERVLERFAQSGARWLVILGDVLTTGREMRCLKAMRPPGRRTPERGGDANHCRARQLR